MSILALSLVACGGGGGSTPPPSQSNNPPPPPTQYTVGGSVTGLSGTGLVLQDNGGDNLPVSASGPFTFATKLNSGAAYAVTVATQPSGQTCTVASGSGTVSANVTNVAVSCAAASSGVTIGGKVQGLTGTGLVLQDNGGDALPVKQNGTFTFPTALAVGAAYAVTVSTQPGSPAQTCTVANGSGTAPSANVTNVVVYCPGNFAYTATNTASGMIYAYAIDPKTGALTQAGTPSADGSHPVAVSLAPNGKFAYSASDNGTKINAFSIDQQTGALTPLPNSPYSPTGFSVGSTYPDIAVDASSTHLYLASAGDAKVAAFTINSDGSLTALPTVAAGTNAGGIPAFSPDGKYLYVLDQNTTGGAVSGYSIGADGSLTQLPGSPFPTGSDPYWISFTPDGKYAYVANNGEDTISAYSVSAGVLQPLATPTFPTTAHPEDLTIDASGTHLYAPVGVGGVNGAIDAYTIGTDGTLAAVAGSPYTVGIQPRYVTIDPTGRFAYTSSAGTGGTGIYGFTVDSTTGVLTPMNGGAPFDTGANSEPQFVTIDPSGQFAYTANQGTGTISEFTIDQTSGVLNPIGGGTVTVTGSPAFVSISPEAPGIRD